MWHRLDFLFGGCSKRSYGHRMNAASAGALSMICVHRCASVANPSSAAANCDAGRRTLEIYALETRYALQNPTAAWSVQRPWRKAHGPLKQRRPPSGLGAHALSHMRILTGRTSRTRSPAAAGHVPPTDRQLAPPIVWRDEQDARGLVDSASVRCRPRPLRELGQPSVGAAV